MNEENELVSKEEMTLGFRRFSSKTTPCFYDILLSEIDKDLFFYNFTPLPVHLQYTTKGFP